MSKVSIHHPSLPEHKLTMKQAISGSDVATARLLRLTSLVVGLPIHAPGSTSAVEVNKLLPFT